MFTGETQINMIGDCDRRTSQPVHSGALRGCRGLGLIRGVGLVFFRLTASEILSAA